MWPARTSGSTPRPRRGGSRGYGLIEVLVSVLILSIGLLGLARLQMIGLRNTQSATLRFEAVNLAYDVLDRMRANRNAALGGSYDVALGASPGGGSLSRADLEDWKAALAATLPEGDGAVTVNGRVATVIVQWSEGWDSGLSDGNATVRLRTQL